MKNYCNTSACSDENALLCIYGLGSEEEMKKCLTLLTEKPKQYIAILEESHPSSEKKLLSSIGKKLLKEERFRFFRWTSDAEREEVFKTVAWEYLFLPFHFSIAEQYLAEREQEARRLFAQLESTMRHVQYYAADFIDGGVLLVKNFFSHLQLAQHAKEALQLQGAFKGTAALICGAGPSLSQHFESIESINQKALLFAGGSTLAILSKQGIVPHFCAGIDPAMPIERFKESHFFEVPFFYQNRLSWAVSALLHAPLLWADNRAVHPLEEAQKGRSPIAFDGGYNVVTFCTALAVHLGCSPILFAGVDLGAKTENLYAEGVEEKAALNSLIKIETSDQNIFYSRPDWLIAVEWLEAFIQEHRDVAFFRMGGQGYPLRGTLPISSTKIKELLPHSFDLKGKIFAHWAELSSMENRYEEASNSFFSSVQRSLEICEELLALFEREFPRSPLEKGEYVLKEYKLMQEFAYRTFLEPMWQVWQYPFRRAARQKLEYAFSRLLFFKERLNNLQGVKWNSTACGKID